MKGGRGGKWGRGAGKGGGEGGWERCFYTVRYAAAHTQGSSHTNNTLETSALPASPLPLSLSISLSLSLPLSRTCITSRHPTSPSLYPCSRHPEMLLQKLGLEIGPTPGHFVPAVHPRPVQGLEGPAARLQNPVLLFAHADRATRRPRLGNGRLGVGLGDEPLHPVDVFYIKPL